MQNLGKFRWRCAGFFIISNLVVNRQKLDDIIKTIDDLLVGSGYECLEVRWESPSDTLRIYIDKPSGINLDDCVGVTKLLEEKQLIPNRAPGSYVLEVSSPGIERPIRKLKDFSQFCGCILKVLLDQQINGRRKGTGKLLSVSDDGEFSIQVDKEIWIFPWENLVRADLVYDWNSVK